MPVAKVVRSGLPSTILPPSAEIPWVARSLLAVTLPPTLMFWVTPTLPLKIESARDVEGALPCADGDRLGAEYSLRRSSEVLLLRR